MSLLFTVERTTESGRIIKSVTRNTLKKKLLTHMLHTLTFKIEREFIYMYNMKKEREIGRELDIVIGPGI